MAKNLLFVTTHNFALNPRLVREVRVSLSLGHKVTVLCFTFQNWSRGLNEQYLREFGKRVCMIILCGDRSNKMAWVTSTLSSIVSGILLPVAPRNIYLLSFHAFKRSWLLYLASKKLSARFDFVIAHNPGSFVPAMYFAERTKAKLGIDIEDYHPGESNDAAASRRLEAIMTKVLEKADVITAASPLIAEQSCRLLSDGMKQHTVIENVFSRKYQPAFKTLRDRPMRLIWFSQIVGLNRGLQDAIKAISAVSAISIQLTIVGNCTAETQSALSGLLKGDCHSIAFLPPMSEEDLFEQCSQHHIGLALEPGFSLNNSLALSNKIYTYLLAGNAIIASETPAQKKFMEENAGIGKTFPIGSIPTLADLLLFYGTASDELLQARKFAYALAREKYNWENEAEKFIGTYQLN